MSVRAKRSWSFLLVLTVVLGLVSAAIVPAAAADPGVYEGKVFSILGDSISTWSGYIPVSDGFNAAHKTRYPDTTRIPDVTRVEQTWWMQVITDLGGKLGINDSWRGTTVFNAETAEINGNTGTKATMSSLTRIQNLGTNGTPDVIFFYGGINDIRQAKTLGEFNTAGHPAPTTADLTSTTFPTVADAYAQTILRMKHYYPDAVIVAMLPGMNTDQASYAEKLPVYNGVFAAICAYYGVPYVDLSAVALDETNLPDGIHPSAAGMDLIAEAVEAKLTSADVTMTAGEHAVYKITHDLTDATASKFYYKSVDGGKSFTETITGGTGEITVIMDGVDVTASVYDDTNGTITIPEVTGYVYITDTLTMDTNSNIYLNKVAKLENNGTYSIDLSGYVTGETVINNYTSAAPLDVVLVLDASGSMLQFRNNAASYYARSIDTFSDGSAWPYAKENYPAGATSSTNLWDEFNVSAGHYINVTNGVPFYDSNSRIQGSIMIPVKPGDKIYCTSFGLVDKTTNNTTNGVRVTYFKEHGAYHSTVSPGTVYSDFNANILRNEDGDAIDRNGKVVTATSKYVHYIVVPDGAYAMNIPVWRKSTDAAPVINNLCLNELRYNPTTTKEFNQMRAKLLHEQVQAFADTLAEASRETGVEHKLAMVTFGGGVTGESNDKSHQGLFGKHVGVNGWTNHFYTNTGLFVNGKFKNYMNYSAADDKVFALDKDGNVQSYNSYRPVFEVDTTKSYYHLEWDEDGDGGYGFDGKMTKVSYDATVGKWIDVNGKTVVPRKTPYDSNKTTLFYTRSAVRAENASELQVQDYTDALTSVLGSDGKLNADLQYAIDRYVARGTTNTRFGLAMANNILKYNKVRSYTDAYGVEHQGRQLVILFTDGASNNNTNTIFTQANDIKGTHKAELYTIGLDEAADLKWMDQISSNNTNVTQSDVDESLELSGGDYYFGISDISELDMVIDTISNDVSISKTSIDLDDGSVMQDYLNDGFILPSDFGFKNISVSTVAVTTEDDTTYLEGATDPYTYQRTDANGYGIYENADGHVLRVSFDIGSGRVAVTNFDYAANFVAADNPGKKLLMRITGVEATRGTTLDSLIDTNKTDSGILYTLQDGTTGVYPFEVPKTQLNSKLYIVDYAKPLVLSTAEWGSGGYLGMATVDRLNCDLNGDEIATNGGTFTYDEVDDTITFTPTSMCWSEPSVFYALGIWQSIPGGVSTGENQWTRITVVPANNIYYEDDFVGIDYQTKAVERTEPAEPADPTGETVPSDPTEVTVAPGWYVDVDGTVRENTVEHHEDDAANGENGIHGWESSLNDLRYSDGSAHKGVADVDTEVMVSFSFTGTGVDIYGRTNDTTGTVLAILEGVGTEGVVQIVDTESVSGDYYQIPTVSFMDLTHGTYTVTLRVTTAAEGRSTYYLDGIRVYDPLADDVLYPENERNAEFTEIRDLLSKTEFAGEAGEGGDTTEWKPTSLGAAFIDKSEDGTIAVAKDYDKDEYGLFGPKNEVYLAPFDAAEQVSQSITFKVKTVTDAHYYVGLKVPSGSGSTTVKVSNGPETNREITVAHATDMYYEVIPDANGYITIENTGNVLLSLTKLRCTSPSVEEQPQLLMMTTGEATFVRQTFAMRPLAVEEEIPADPQAPDDAGTPESSVPETTEEPQDPQSPITGFASWLWGLLERIFWFLD